MVPVLPPHCNSRPLSAAQGDTPLNISNVQHAQTKQIEENYNWTFLHWLETESTYNNGNMPIYILLEWIIKEMCRKHGHTYKRKFYILTDVLLGPITHVDQGKYWFKECKIQVSLHCMYPPNILLMFTIQDVPGGTCQTSGGCSLC